MENQNIIKMDERILRVWHSQLMNIEVKGQSVKLVALMMQDLESIMAGNIMSVGDDINVE